jgi:hypothetical protein
VGELKSYAWSMSGTTKRIDLSEDHYTLFNATRDDLPEIIVVNDALLAFPSHVKALRRWAASVTLRVLLP